MGSRSILISGAGVAGVTLAYWLRARGFEPVIVERSPGFREGGYMIDFWGVGFDVAERMELVPRLRAAGYDMDRLRFLNDDGSIRSELGANAVHRVLGRRFISILRGDLARAVFDLIDGKVEMIFGDSITAIRPHNDGIEVAFECQEPRPFDLVVGADGLRSRVRMLAFGSESAFERYLGFYAASFIAKAYPHRDEKTYVSYADPGRQISRYALRDNLTAFLLVVASRDKPRFDHGDVGAQKQRLQTAFEGIHWDEAPAALERLEACNELYCDAVSQIAMPQWSAGRVVLIGDAAYCASLMAGQGSAFAMLGAYLLARELDRAGDDHETAFASFEANLRPFIERKQKYARGFASSFAPTTRLGLFLRDQVIRSMNIPVLGDWMMDRMLRDDFRLPDDAT